MSVAAQLPDERPARDDAEIRRARWRSRRGMLELDLLLARFAEHRYGGLSEADQDAYLELLRLDDWVIWDWLQEARTAPPHLARIVALIAAQGEEHRA